MTQLPAHDLCHLVNLVLGDAAIRQLAVDDLGELAVLVDLGQPPAITVGDKQTGGVRADVDACAAHEPSGSPPALAPSSDPRRALYCRDAAEAPPPGTLLLASSVRVRVCDRGPRPAEDLRRLRGGAGDRFLRPPRRDLRPARTE